MNWPYEFDFEHLDAENEHWKWCTCLDKEVYFRHKHVSPVIKKNTFLTKVYFLVIGFELKEKSKKSSERLSSGASDDKSQLVGGSSPPIWKICSSNWIISPRFGVNIKNLWNHQPVTTKKGQFPLFFPSKSQHPNLRVPRSQKKKTQLNETWNPRCQRMEDKQIGRPFSNSRFLSSADLHMSLEPKSLQKSIAMIYLMVKWWNGPVIFFQKQKK